jgi:hypothetical protein
VIPPSAIFALEGISSGEEELLLNAVWDWVMDPMAYQHCPDCPVLSANSPYTLETLPALPGDGHTRCNDRCRCHLEYHFTQEEVGIIVPPGTPGPEPITPVPSSGPYEPTGGIPYVPAPATPYPGKTGATPYPGKTGATPYHGEGSVDMTPPPADVYIPPFAYSPKREGPRLRPVEGEPTGDTYVDPRGGGVVVVVGGGPTTDYPPVNYPLLPEPYDKNWNLHRSAPAPWNMLPVPPPWWDPKVTPWGF